MTAQMPVPYSCPNCGSKYVAFRLYCKSCGCIMPNALSSKEVTRLLMDNVPQQVNFEWGRRYFHRYARLVLRRDDSGDVIPVPLDKPPVMLGKPSVNFKPTVTFDLSQTDDMGVSRVHARIDRGDSTLSVIDLDSTNGTFLDGIQLVPQMSAILHNRAVLQLGKLVLRGEFR